MVLIMLLTHLAGGVAVSTTVSFVPGPADANMSTLVASPNIAAGNGSAAISLVTTVRDSQGNLVPGANVALSASGGNNTFGAAIGSTAADGTYTTTLTSTLMQKETITASFGGGSLYEMASVTFTGNANATTSSLSISPSSQTVGPSNLINATLTLRDGASNLLVGVAPAWGASGAHTNISSSGSTSSSGVATATYSSTLAQNENITVSAGGIILMGPIVLTAGSPNGTTSSLFASPPQQVANNSNVISAYLTLRDIYNNGISGTNATFTTSGVNNIISASGATNANGIVRGTYSTGTIQNENITVSAGGLVITRPVIFSDIPASCTLTASPVSQIADGNSPIVVTANVTNSSNQNVANLMVTFSSAGAAQSFSSSHVVTSASGQATTSLTSLYGGSNKLTAQAANVTCTTNIRFTSRTAFCAGTPNFVLSSYPTDGYSRGLLSSDFNNDGLVDLAVLSIVGKLSVYLQTSSGTMSIKKTFDLGGASQAGAVGDINSDGLQDIVTSNNGSFGILLGAGNGNFTAPVLYPAAAFYGAVALDDFNADGAIDAVVSNGGNKLVNLFLGIGDGTFLTPQQFAVGNYPDAVLSGDFNGDGNRDVVVSNHSDNTIQILLGDGQGHLQGQTTYAVTPNGGGQILVGDFNGDGNQDVAAGGFSSNINIFLGQGNGNLAGGVSYSTGTPPNGSTTATLGLTVGDFNGDGRQDIVSSNFYGDTASVFLGLGDGSFSTPNINTAYVGPVSVVSGDFNHDGYQDYAIAGYNSNTLAVFTYSGCN